MKRKGMDLVQLGVYAVAIGIMLMVLLPRNQSTIKGARANGDISTINSIVEAVQVYHYEVKGYPTSLASLTTKNGDLGPWLQVLPRDNYGHAFNYTFGSNGFAVWSCGPDGVDNTGAASALSESFINDDVGKASK